MICDRFDHPGAARAALAAARPAADPVAVDPIGRGNRKHTALVEFAVAPPVVVQTSDDARALRTEATLLDALRARTDVPVPDPLAAGTAEGAAYLVTPHVEGADLHERFVAIDDERRRDLVAAFGRHLAAIHDAFAFDGYGPLAADGDALAVEGRRTWREWLEAYALSALDRLPPAFDDLQSDLGAVATDPAVPASPRATLFPWDFRPGNALVDDGDLAAILDWEAPLAAPAPLSVAKARYLVADWYVEDAAPLRAAFRAGYESVRPYPEVRPVHRVATVADSAVDSTGAVTNPRYPELDREASVDVHREALEAALADGRR